jgi:glutaredoxin
MTTTKVETKPIPKTITKPATKVEKPEHRIRDTDNKNAWTVITIEDCEWCDKTIRLLEEHKENFKTVKLTHEWFRRLVVEYEVRRLPAVFLGNAYFGSYSELENYYKCSFVSSKEVF